MAGFVWQESNSYKKQGSCVIISFGVNLRRGEIMRGIFIVSLLIVSLIVGLLVIKNMGANNSEGVTKTQTKQYVQKAEGAADDLNKSLNNISKQAKEADAD
jgi:type VI protein secretion system component VasK